MKNFASEIDCNLIVFQAYNKVSQVEKKYTIIFIFLN